MTETTDIKALREAALKATAAEWCTDSLHSVIADAGLNANYYVAACSGPDSKANAKFISLANPATIISLLDQLEAERRNVGVLEGVIARKEFDAQRAELAALRGEQEPYGYCSAETEQVLKNCGHATITNKPVGSWQHPLFTRQPKPVVVLPKLTVGEVMHRSGFDRQYAEGWVSANDWAINELKLAGIVVKDGE